MSNNLYEQEESIKVILLGNSGVGKTQIINRFNNKQFMDNDLCTYTSSFITRAIEVNGQKKNLDVWDTAGQEKFRSLGKLFVKNAQIIILVYDTTSKKSFEDLNFWNDFIQKELGQKITLGLAGNKIDLFTKEEVTKDEGKEYAKKWDAVFSLLSAKEDKPGIDLFFTEMVKKYLENETGGSNNEEKNKQLKINNDNNNNKTSCCGGSK
jgi:small GTP-binding protein